MIRIPQLFGPVQAQISASLRTQEVAPEQLTADSRTAKADSIFFAIRGTTHDGHTHVDGLLRSGILACVVEKDFEGTDPRLIRVQDTREAMGWAMSRLHGDPSRSMMMIGITGTSGKTTTTYLVESILQAAGHRVGVIGTVNFRIGSEIIPSTHTTPGAPELQALLARMKQSGCTAVVMEVSSHALKQHRTSGITFDGVVFNNLSPEHLDFHLDMEDYYQSKKLLFSVYPRHSEHAQKRCVSAINLDDDYGNRLLSELRAGFGEFLGFGMGGGSDVSGSGLTLGMDGIRGRIQWKDGVSIEVASSLIARFNAYNILAAASVCRAVGIDPQKISEGISRLPGVPGRLEQVLNELGATLLVDYAHKPDALEKVLKTLIELRKPGQRIISVVGCGGDRDRSKRPVMGRLAEQLSDLAIITSDNPRTEDPSGIIQEILAGVAPASVGSRVRVEPDRALAIELAVNEAAPGDMVLIAGKGHEDYQIIADRNSPGGTRKIHFDDREEAARAARQRGSGGAGG